MAEDSEQYQQLVEMDEQQVSTRLIKFLRRIDADGAEDLNFAIKLTPDGAFTVNGKDANQLMAIFGEELAPLMMQQQPALAEPPVSMEEQPVQAVPVDPVAVTNTPMEGQQ